MAVADRIVNHPLWPTLQQAEATLSAMPASVRQYNPDLVDRAQATLGFLRALLTQANGAVVADQVLANFHSWVQQVNNEAQSATANPGQPQFVQNLAGAVDAIAQNFGQLPPVPGAPQVVAIVDEAQRRLDAMVTMQTEARERVRLLADQVGSELERARENSAQGLEAVREKQKLADALLAELGEKGSSSSYLATAEEEKTAADRWRVATIVLGISTGVASLLSGHELAKHTASGITSRATLLLPLVLLTIYAGRQAAEHRSQQRRVRTLGLQLASIGTFLADLTPEGRDTIKRDVSHRMFGDDGSSAGSGTDGYPSSQDLVQLLGEAIAKFPQLR